MRKFLRVGGLPLTIAVTLAATWVLSPAPASGPVLEDGPVDELEWRVDSTFALRRRLLGQQRAYARADAERRAAALPTTAGFTIRVERGVEAAVAATIRQAAITEMEELTPRVRYPVTLVAYVDSSVTSSYSRAIVLPDAPGRPCVAFVRVGISNPVRFQIARADQVLGTCGFYAKYGAAGAGMDRWLEQTAMRSSAGHTPAASSERAPVKLEPHDLATSPIFGACTANRMGACTRLLQGDLEWLSQQGWWTVYTTPSGDAGPSRVSVVGVGAATGYASQLAMVRRALGDARFESVWTSNGDWMAEFERNEGFPPAQVVREAVLLEVLPHMPGPMPNGKDAIVTLFLVAALAGSSITFARRHYR